jgi:xanthine dehydrogenase accessory factor
MDIFDFITEKKRQGQNLVLATVVRTKGSSPAKPGKKMAIAEDHSRSGTVGGGALEAKVLEEAEAVLAEKKPRLLRFRLNAKEASEEGMLCGGEQEVFLDIIASSRHLLIFGGGHLARALSAVAEAIGFPYSVVDDREEFVSRERFPRARKLLRFDYSDSWGNLPINRDTCVVIVTRGHLFDQICLEKAVSTPAGYIGMIGSKRKVKKILDALRKKGVKIPPEGRVYTPMGLDLGDNSPEEIAVSIMAEIIAVKSGGSGRHLREIGAKKGKTKTKVRGR